MAPFPGFVEPELATSADKLPSGKCRLHQIKFDDCPSSFTSATRTNLRPFIASARLDQELQARSPMTRS